MGIRISLIVVVNHVLGKLIILGCKEKKEFSIPGSGMPVMPAL
jgi:hypothetical protein